MPARLKSEAEKSGLKLSVKEIFLGSYISFHDEVRLNDISRALNNAFKENILPDLKKEEKIICITHSTGGPVLRDWWNRYYKTEESIFSVSHLIMLAPANFGSALAQLGKGKLSRLKSWWNDIEPGQGVLNWLCIGSRESWDLNKSWIEEGEKHVGESEFFPFVITGQSIDRKFYDHLNPYTGELGSDGVVRVASANLKGRIISLIQKSISTPNGNKISNEFVIEKFREAPESPLFVLKNKSHSGDEKGIMKSVKNNSEQNETVQAILKCIQVNSIEDYRILVSDFTNETQKNQKAGQLESFDGGLFASERYFIHDRFSMVIFRVHDHEGFPISDYDLILTAGIENNPNHLPEGFFADRQKNSINNETLTYFFNYDVMKGCDEIRNEKGEIIREKIQGTTMLGLEIRPRPDKGFVRYQPCSIKASEEMLEKVLVPNSTTLIDICLQRIVDKQVFETEKFSVISNSSAIENDFSGINPGKEIVA
ncbi:phospholipase [soil metagenome]